MRYLISSSIFLLLAVNGLSQSVSPEVIASAGDRFSSSDLILEWTLGELMTETIEDGNVLTQGFHQPQIAITSIDDPEGLMNLVSIGPNPTEGRLLIQTEQELTIRLFDLKGAQLLTWNLAQASTEVDLSHLPAGMYVLQINQPSSRNMTMKILKR